MKAKRFSEEQIIVVLEEAEAGAKTKENAPKIPSVLKCQRCLRHKTPQLCDRNGP